VVGADGDAIDVGLRVLFGNGCGGRAGDGQPEQRLGLRLMLPRLLALGRLLSVQLLASLIDHGRAVQLGIGLVRRLLGLEAEQALDLADEAAVGLAVGLGLGLAGAGDSAGHGYRHHLAVGDSFHAHQVGADAAAALPRGLLVGPGGVVADEGAGVGAYVVGSDGSRRRDGLALGQGAAEAPHGQLLVGVQPQAPGLDGGIMADRGVSTVINLVEGEDAIAGDAGALAGAGAEGKEPVAAVSVHDHAVGRYHRAGTDAGLGGVPVLPRVDGAAGAGRLLAAAGTSQAQQLVIARDVDAFADSAGLDAYRILPIDPEVAVQLAAPGAAIGPAGKLGAVSDPGPGAVLALEIAQGAGEAELLGLAGSIGVAGEDLPGRVGDGEVGREIVQQLRLGVPLVEHRHGQRQLG